MYLLIIKDLSGDYEWKISGRSLLEISQESRVSLSLLKILDKHKVYRFCGCDYELKKRKTVHRLCG